MESPMPTQAEIAEALELKLRELVNTYEDAHEAFMNSVAVATRTARENEEHKKVLELTKQLSS